jgi:hypothetical protein
MPARCYHRNEAMNEFDERAIDNEPCTCVTMVLVLV